MRQQGISFRHVLLPDNEDHEQNQGDDEWSEENGAAPTIDGSLGESEDEQDQSSHDQSDTTKIHSLDLLPSRQRLSDCFGFGHREPGQDAEWEDEDGDKSEVPSPRAQEEKPGEDKGKHIGKSTLIFSNESERDCNQLTGHSEQCESLSLLRWIREHLNNHIQRTGDGENR